MQLFQDFKLIKTCKKKYEKCNCAFSATFLATMQQLHSHSLSLDLDAAGCKLKAFYNILAQSTQWTKSLGQRQHAMVQTK